MMRCSESVLRLGYDTNGKVLANHVHLRELLEPKGFSRRFGYLIIQVSRQLENAGNTVSIPKMTVCALEGAEYDIGKDPMSVIPLQSGLIIGGGDAVLQGYCGHAVANAGPEPLVAQITINPVTFFGGNPAHPAARHLIERLVGEKIIIVSEPGWREMISQVHGPQITTESRRPFSPDRLNLEHLRRLMTRVPDGAQITRIDLELAKRIRAEVSADLVLSEVDMSTVFRTKN